jgi:hypothetical protein
MSETDIEKSIAALRAAALKAIRFGYLDLASQIMFVSETLERSGVDNLIELPPTLLTLKRDTAS